MWGIPSLPIEVRSVEELFPSRKFLKKNPREYYILLYFHALLNNRKLCEYISLTFVAVNRLLIDFNS